jgi:hypothetical protein
MWIEDRVLDPVLDWDLRNSYELARKAMIDAYEAQATDRVRTDPAYRNLADALHRAAAALSEDAPAALPAQQSDWQWEEYGNDDGPNSFLVFVRYDFTASQLHRLIETYSVVSDAQMPGVRRALPWRAFMTEDSRSPQVGAPWAKGLTPAPRPK